VGQILFAANGMTEMTTTNGYDRLNRLTNTALLGGTGSTRSQFDCRYNSASQGSHFCAYDGNGNVTALVKADGAGLTAQYEYGPFGELLRATDPMAKANPFRFSTKYQDDETDLIYYGYRYYNPSTERWLNRDPIGYCVGLNRVCFVGNEPVGRVDLLERESWDTIWREAGKNGCPACEFNDVQQRLKSWERILDRLRQGKPPRGGSGSGATTVGETSCLVGNPRTVIKEGYTTCKGWCIVRHEQVHRDQCQHHYSDYKWTLPRSNKEEVEMELPAYEAGAKRFTALVKKAKNQAARFGGDMKRACQRSK